ncbi:MAG: hypothetical protein DI586_09425, partial [Micavibrio aeruginosavorus]
MIEKVKESWAGVVQSGPIQKLSQSWNSVTGYPYKQKAKELIYETPIEVFIGAAAVGMAVGTISYEHEDSKQGQIPLAFSEAGQLKKKLGWKKQEVPPLSRFYGVTNDISMMVFEANNLGYAWDHNHPKFAYELEKKIEPTMRIQHLITDYQPEFHKMSKDALRSIKKATDASRDIRPVIQALDNAWDDEHYARYRMETYTYSVCSSNGKSTTCSTRVGVRPVYDHTDHYYYYHPKQGRLAAELLKDFIAKYPDIKIDEKLIRITETGAENEWAMRESRKKLSDYKPLKQEDYIRLANIWATGSNYNVFMPIAYQQHAGVAQMTPQWNKAQYTANDESYSTYARYSDGPEEFQIAEAALKYAVNMSRSINKVSGGIQYADQNLPELQQKIKQYVDCVLHGGEGNAKELRNEI